MSGEKPAPDELTKTTTGDITLTEADLNNVSGGTSIYVKCGDAKIESDLLSAEAGLIPARGRR